MQNIRYNRLGITLSKLKIELQDSIEHERSKLLEIRYMYGNTAHANHLISVLG